MQDRIVCDCGKLSRCTEGLSSSRGIEWLFHQTASRQANSKIAQFQKQLGRPARLKDLAPLIRAHDPEIMATLKSALTPLANRLCLLLFLLDLEAVLVGGGSSALGDDLIKPLAAMVRERMWEKYSETVAFKVCELHNDAGITGAGGVSAHALPTSGLTTMSSSK